MIYLDTHVIVWFFAGEKKRFPNQVQTLMNEHDWRISPIVRLELQYLHEIGRITTKADEIISELTDQVNLTICPKPFSQVVAEAVKIEWTRDVFDRLLVAQASLHGDILVSKDRTILSHYKFACWEE